MTNHDELCEKDVEKDRLFEKGQLLVQQASEIKELRTRVAEQNKIIEHSRIDYRLKAEEIKTLKELQKRVAELEGALKYTEGIRSRTTEDIAKHNEELQSRLSTLLKASEGMEKALEGCIKSAETHDDAWDIAVDVPRVAFAKQALADFRAVKEWK